MVEQVERASLGGTFDARSRAHVGLSHLLRFGEALCFVVLPLLGPFLLAEYLLGLYQVHPMTTIDGNYYPDGGFLFDLRTMWTAGHAIVTGHSPYPVFIYPAPAAILMVPFGFLPWKLAVVAFAFFVTACLFLTLRLLGVRDWRCYSVALASMPATSSMTLGSLSTFIPLCAALAWRYRDRRWVAATGIAAAVVTKIFLWPLVIWLVATRRFRAAVASVIVGVGMLLGSWALLGFDGLLDYPRRLRFVADVEQTRSYSPFSLLQLLGMSETSARVVLLGMTLAAAVAIVLIARTRDGDRRAFVAAIAAALILSPIVWIHYLVLVFVVVALYQRRLGLAWMIPLAFWAIPGQDNKGSIVVLLAAWAITLAVALATLGRRPAAATA